MANFGIGLGAFADGFARGVGIRRQMNANKREDRQMEREEAREKAFAQAKIDYDKDIADKVLAQAGQANTEGGVSAFDASGAANKAREENPFMEFLYNKKSP